MIQRSQVQGLLFEGYHYFSAFSWLKFFFAFDFFCFLCVCVCLGCKDSKYLRVRAESAGHPHVVQVLHRTGPHPYSLGWVAPSLSGSWTSVWVLHDILTRLTARPQYPQCIRCCVRQNLPLSCCPVSIYFCSVWFCKETGSKLEFCC